MIIFWQFLSYSSGTVPYQEPITLALLIGETDLLATFYFIDVDTCYLFLNDLLRVLATNKNTSPVAGYTRVYIHQKFKGLDSSEITSLPDIEKVIYMARHFNPRRK